MSRKAQAYIDGAWVDPAVATPFDLVSPASEEVIATLGLCGAAEVDRAVAAAQRAFPAFAATSVADRVALLRPHPGRVRGAHRGVRAGDDARDGHADQLLARGAGALRHRASADHDRGARELRVRAPDGRHADRARADRRVRADHAVELAGQPDRLQGGARAGGRLHDGAQAVRTGAAVGDPVGRDDARGRACRPACSTWCRATGRPWARRLRRIPASTWSASPGRTAPARGWRRWRHPPSSGWRRNWAASRPTSCWRTSTCPTRWRAAWPAASTTTASPATRRRACSCPLHLHDEAAAAGGRGGAGVRGRRPGGPGDHARPGGQPAAVRPHPVADRGRHRRGRASGHRRHRAGRTG